MNTMVMVNGTEYAIGIPIDNPVMLLSTYNPASPGPNESPPPADSIVESLDDGTQLYEVTESQLGEDEFDTLIQHITTEMNEENDAEREAGRIGFHDSSVYLLNTPAVLTVQGRVDVDNDDDISSDDDDNDDDDDDVGDYDGNDYEEIQDSAESNTDQVTSFNEEELCSDPTTEDPFSVTDDDVEAFEEAHRYVSDVLTDAEDVKLIGSFHFKKQNYHLAKITEVSWGR
jgi:hypothetical protein